MPAEEPERFPESVELGGRRRQTARGEFSERRRILGLLREGPRTIPEIASALALPTEQATWWLMGYLRYGQVRASEKPDSEGYFRYSLVGEK